MGESTFTIERLGNMQLTRRLTEARDDQDFRQAGPGNLWRPADLGRIKSSGGLREKTIQEFPQAKLLRELERKPDVAKAPGSLDAHLAYVDLDPLRQRLLEE